MCDVVFITPNIHGTVSEEVIGTLQLATILKQNGITCEIVPFFQIGDLSAFSDFLDNAVKLLREKQPKIVSIYTRCDTYHIDIKLAQRIKAQLENTYLVFGGPQSDITAVETVTQLPFVDFVCCGEGENTVYPFFSSLLKGQPDVSVPGLVYRYGGEIRKNPRPALMQDLDSAPLVDYTMFHYQDDGKYFRIDVGRGCPFACTYCSTNSFWGRKYRLKSPERIYREIVAAHNAFGVTKFAFSHDMFTLNRNKVIETCKLLKTLDFPIKWACSARMDCLDEELIDIMADAGMNGVFVGIETGSPRMQKLINKNLKLDNTQKIVAYMKSKGVETVASFIYGFPEETPEDLSQTLCMIRDLLQQRIKSLKLHLCTFMSGTELSERYQSVMTRSKQYSDQTGSYATAECEHLFDEHPDLFTHMFEYHTEFRDSLKYFSFFGMIWQAMQPVYQYISEKYPPERLLDMYYDFVKANEALLSNIADIEEPGWLKKLQQDDRFVKSFADDSNYDLIADFYRMKNLENNLKNGETAVDAFCFSPAERERPISLQDYERRFTFVTYKKGKYGKISYSCQ